ncbi:transposase, partial [Ralstonia pseudosolanacearum]
MRPGILFALRLVKAGHSMAAADAAPGVADQTLFNWVKAAREDRLAGMDTQPASPEPMALARLRAEAARLKMAHDVPRKRPSGCELHPKSWTSVQPLG